MQSHNSKRKSDDEISMLRCFEFKVESFKNTTIQLVDDLTDKREKALAKQWLEKLFRELLRSGERSADALEYLFFLMCSLQTREPLEHPFTQPPPNIDDRLFPLHYELDTFTYTENLRSLKNDLYLDRYLRKEKEAKSRTKTLLEQMIRPTELNMYPTKKDRAMAAAARSSTAKTSPEPTSGGPMLSSSSETKYESDGGPAMGDSEPNPPDKTSIASTAGSRKSGKSKASGKSKESEKGSRKSKGSQKSKGGGKASRSKSAKKAGDKKKKPAKVATKK